MGMLAIKLRKLTQRLDHAVGDSSVGGGQA